MLGGRGPRWIALWLLLAAAAAFLAAPGWAELSSQRARSAAERDAVGLLGRVILPSGAIRLSAEPAGDHGLLAHPGQQLTGLVVGRHGWWRVDASLATVAAFVLAHPPTGASNSGTGQLGGPGVPANELFSFSLSPRRGFSSARTVAYDLVALGHGNTGVRVDTQITWLRQRLPSERIPAGVRAVDVSSARPGQAPLVSRTVTAHVTVSGIERALDALPIVQPGVYACPSVPGNSPVVKLAFRAAPGGRILAQASGFDLGYAGGPCDPIAFSIGRRTQTPLSGSHFFSTLQRLLGVPLR